MYIGGLFIEDDTYAKIHATGSDVIPCQYCGRHLIEVRDVRSKSNYCEECSHKVSRLSRYSNGLYHPDKSERARIVGSMTRAGK